MKNVKYVVKCKVTTAHYQWTGSKTDNKLSTAKTLAVRVRNVYAWELVTFKKSLGKAANNDLNFGASETDLPIGSKLRFLK